MTAHTNAIFNAAQIDLIREAHQEWCSQRSFDPASHVGEDVASMMMELVCSGASTKEELVGTCDSFVREKEAQVRLGTIAIKSC